MSDAFCGEIRLFTFGFVPAEWLPCDGSLHLVSQYGPLASIVGNIYGGDGRTTFAVPDLRGSVVIGAGTGVDGIPYRVGQAVGEDTVTLDATEMPTHTHVLQSQPGSHLKAQSTSTVMGSLIPMPQITPSPIYPSYATPAVDNQVPMAEAAIGSTGGGMSHDNHQPYILLGYFICTSDQNYPIRPS